MIEPTITDRLRDLQSTVDDLRCDISNIEKLLARLLPDDPTPPVLVSIWEVRA